MASLPFLSILTAALTLTAGCGRAGAPTARTTLESRGRGGERWSARDRHRQGVVERFSARAELLSEPGVRPRLRITVARNGLPAASAVVVLLDPDGLELTRGRTATNGRVELPAFDLPAREGPLAIEVNGRPAGETSALAALRFSAAAELLSAPGNPPRLRITVTRYDAPVSGAVVVLLDPEGLELVRGTTTIDGLVELMPFALPTSTGPLAIEVDGRVAEETSVLGPLHAAVRAECRWPSGNVEI